MDDSGSYQRKARLVINELTAGAIYAYQVRAYGKTGWTGGANGSRRCPYNQANNNFSNLEFELSEFSNELVYIFPQYLITKIGVLKIRRIQI